MQDVNVQVYVNKYNTNTEEWFLYCTGSSRLWNSWTQCRNSLNTCPVEIRVYNVLPKVNTQAETCMRFASETHKHTLCSTCVMRHVTSVSDPIGRLSLKNTRHKLLQLINGERENRNEIEHF